jgi:hypothetical protein
MSAATATIRVARETRDRLAARARSRGMSVSALLAEVVRNAERDAIFRAERRASRADSGDSLVIAEDQEWELTLGDGLP